MQFNETRQLILFIFEDRVYFKKDYHTPEYLFDGVPAVPSKHPEFMSGPRTFHKIETPGTKTSKISAYVLKEDFRGSKFPDRLTPAEYHARFDEEDVGTLYDKEYEYISNPPTEFTNYKIFHMDGEPKPLPPGVTPMSGAFMTEYPWLHYQLPCRINVELLFPRVKKAVEELIGDKNKFIKVTSWEHSKEIWLGVSYRLDHNLVINTNITLHRTPKQVKNLEASSTSAQYKIVCKGNIAGDNVEDIEKKIAEYLEEVILPAKEMLNSTSKIEFIMKEWEKSRA